MQIKAKQVNDIVENPMIKGFQNSKIKGIYPLFWATQSRPKQPIL